MLLAPLTGYGQVVNTMPKIVYALPAGGQRGTTVEVTIAGSQLGQATGLLVDGDRFEAWIEHDYDSMLKPLEREERAALRRALSLAQSGKTIPDDLRDEIPDLPILWPLNNPDTTPSELDLRRIEYEFVLYPQVRLRQTLRLGLSLRTRFRIPKDVPPGPYTVRLATQFGTSAPFYFIVGDCPEVLEAEPCTPEEQPVDPPFDLPICINGQTYPGDVDKYRFHAKQGQTLSLHAAARELKPFLADGVPGWFDAVITLYDPDGKELAYSDCTDFDPDPTLIFTAPRDGVYTVELRDTLYRGRWDFIYRLTIREQDPAPPKKFAHILAKPEAVNVHPFEGKQGREMSIRTVARTLGSPADTYLQVIDKRGKVLAENDDAPHSLNVGLQTAVADSYLLFTPPADGTYAVRVSDTSQRGGPDYGYELHVAPAAPGFDCYVTPAVVDSGPGRGAPITFHAVRRDGFTGEIFVRLAESSAGFQLDGAVIPAGQDSITAVLYTPPRAAIGSRITLKLVASARAGAKTISADVVPADDWEQAFIWHHLVPTESFQVHFPRRRSNFAPGFRREQLPRLRLVPEQASTAQVGVVFGAADNLDFRLVHGPKGVTLMSSKVEDGVVHLEFSAENAVTERGNLIVEALFNMKSQRGTGNSGRIRIGVGVLPPIPYGP